MSVKLIFPFVGIAGTVAGAVGASFSSSTSKGSVTNNSSFLEGMKAGDIEVSLNCLRSLSGSSQNDDFTFKWKGKKINGGQLSKLKQNQDFEIIGDFWFESNNNWNAMDKFAPGEGGSGEVYLSAQFNDRNRLSVTLGRSTNGRTFSGTDTTDKFLCSLVESEWKKLKDETEDSLVYFAKMNMSRYNAMTSYHDSKMKASWNNCQSDGKGKTTCDLQLSSMDENTNLKIFQKSHLTFPK